VEGCRHDNQIRVGSEESGVDHEANSVLQVKASVAPEYQR
jgi:hypothetical protein